MGLFGGKLFGSGGKEPEIEELPPSRRRPLPGDEGQKRPQAFSYYANRGSGSSDARRSDGELRATRAPLGPRLSATAPQRPASASEGAKWWQNRIVATMVIVAAVGLLGAMTYMSTNPKIVTVTDSSSGNAYFLQDKALYQQAAAKQLSGSLLNKNKLLADKPGLAAKLRGQYPEIAKASLQVPLIGTQPVVRIEPTRPSFILTTTDNGAYLLDETGRALVSTSQIQDSGELSVPTLRDQTGSPVKLGTQALPGTTVAFAEQVLGYLKAANVDYGLVTLPATVGELDVAIKNTPYFVKFNLTGDSRLQAGTFLAAKGRLDKDKVVPQKYIDVRVPERAYYQ